MLKVLVCPDRQCSAIQKQRERVREKERERERGGGRVRAYGARDTFSHNFYFYVVQTAERVYVIVM